jgi:HAMP domain-containing protein
MFIVQSVRRSLGAKVALKLAAVVLALTVLAATFIIAHQTKQMEDQTLEKARLAARVGARHYGDALEGAIDHGLLTVQDAFDRNYVEIKGHTWGSKPRFHSRYDVLVDAAVVRFLDTIIEDESFVFAIGVDDRTYMPTHTTKFSQPFTDIPEKDLVVNRAKVMTNYPVGTAAAQNLEPSFLQVYKRDTGETMWDVSSPIFVKGKHWGAFRVGVSMKQIAARQRSLLFTLLGIFAVFLGVTVATLFFVVRSAMRPVVELTAAAAQISLGEALDTPIKSTDVDEIGRLTKTIDRLRVSMKAAMSRLGH